MQSFIKKHQGLFVERPREIKEFALTHPLISQGEFYPSCHVRNINRCGMIEINLDTNQNIRTFVLKLKKTLES